MAAPRKNTAAKAAAEDGMCVEHFPDGFDHPALAGQSAVACEHGQWDRGDDVEDDGGSNPDETK